MPGTYYFDTYLEAECWDSMLVWHLPCSSLPGSRHGWWPGVVE